MVTRVWDYLPEYEKEREDLLDAVEKVFDSGRLVLGKSVSGFEEEFAAYHEVSHCVGVDNGTNAVKLALQAMDIGPGDEVVTVSNTAAPTVIAIDAVGATPVFVDVREDDYLMDTSQVEAAITHRTKALLPVHLYGQCVETAPLRELADRHGLHLVEDCAQAHGARHHGTDQPRGTENGDQRTRGPLSFRIRSRFLPVQRLPVVGPGDAPAVGHTRPPPARPVSVNEDRRTRGDRAIVVDVDDVPQHTCYSERGTRAPAPASVHPGSGPGTSRPGC